MTNKSNNLLLSSKQIPEHTVVEKRMSLAVRLYELGYVTTGRAARIAGMGRVDFIFELAKYDLSPIGVDPDELESDLANA